MFLLDWAVCDSKKSHPLKEQEAKRLLGNLPGAKRLIFSDIPFINTLFYFLNAGKVFISRR